MMERLASALSDRYRIEHELGQGGMATVYRAHDVRHDRKVAIKIVHPELAAVLGAERFLTEMRVTANLQHPHILPLFDSGSADGQLYYVMPLVEGESLRDRLTRERQLPVDDAVRLAIEVAGALDYAHRHNVVHRDIKPENILLHDGSALVADFGIALAVSNAGDKRLTQTGLSLGTPHYMSPEQATGDKVVDGRTDIYSLGCVLFEMLTGEPPFSGPSTQAIVAKVLTEAAPTVRSRRPTVPPALEAVTLKALQKLPADRFATPQAFAQALRTPESVTIAASPAATRAPMAMWQRVAAAVVVAGLLYGAYAFGGRRAPRPDAQRRIMDRLGGPSIAMNPRVSPDGKTIAFAAMVRNQTQLGVLNPETGDWRVLTTDSTQGFMSAPEWAPDGSRIYYSRYTEGPNGIYSITPLGSDERLVLAQADMPVPLKDGSLLVSRLNKYRRLQLYRYWPSSARLDSLPGSAGHEWGKSFASVFPDGDEAVFVGSPDADGTGKRGVYAINLATKVSRLLPVGGMNVALGAGVSFGVSADGQSVLLPTSVGAGSGVIAVPRDGSGRVTLILTTTSTVIGVDGGPDGAVYVDQVNRDCAGFRYDETSRRVETFDLLTACGNTALPLPDGRLIETEVGNPPRVVVMKPGASPTRFLESTQATGNPGPLGNDRVLVQVGANGDSLAIAMASTGQVIGRVPFVAGAYSIVGSPDGATIYFARAGAIWSRTVAGGEPRRVRDGEFVTIDPSGKYLVVAVNGADGVKLYHVPLDGTAESLIPVQKPFRLATIAFGNRAVAADGRILVTLVSASSWHWQAGILDPRTGHVTVLPVSTEHDVEASWGYDGSIWVVGADIESTLWRYRPAPKAGS